MQKHSLRIIFMGTPEFAVESLDAVVKNNFNIVAVITMPDKPAGRGQSIQHSAVKKYALENQLHILQPTNLKDEKFLKELKSLNADLQIVVAFRMLPEVVWQMPRLGTFNLHASLLPKYRGAAPINWAIMNGEIETGVTTFFLQQKIDTGEIIFREKITINENKTASELHNELMVIGAGLVVKTTEAIETGNYITQSQDNYSTSGELGKQAPKLFKEDCKINWNQSASVVHNFIRGLSAYPGAYSTLISKDSNSYILKIFLSSKIIEEHSFAIGQIQTDSRHFLKIACTDGFVLINELQLAGKKKLAVAEFLRGFHITNEWNVV